MWPWFSARFMQFGITLTVLSFIVASLAWVPEARSDAVFWGAETGAIREFLSENDSPGVHLLAPLAPVSRSGGSPGPSPDQFAGTPHAAAPNSRASQSPAPSRKQAATPAAQAPVAFSRVDGSHGLSPSPAPAPRVRAPTPTPTPAPTPTPTASAANGPAPGTGRAHVPLLAPNEAPSFAPSPTTGTGTPVFLPPQDSQKKQTPKTAMVAVIAGVGFGVLIVGVILVAIVCRFSRRSRAAAVLPWKVGMSGPMQKPFVTTIPAISRAELEVACEDFSNIVGSSSDTTVFKGTLTDGTEIAAIRMASECWNSKAEIAFRLKIESLARMNHTHLVNLIAYCSVDDPFERLFVFEYASNGTLYEHLHLRESEQLSWPIRMRIIMGAAYGLRYMHHEAVPTTSHQNFDSRAIYLTEDFASKLAEFAASKDAVLKRDHLGSRTDSSLDYDSAEGSDSRAPDFDNNVYSFGVLLLEVVTGRPQGDKEGSLVDWAATFINNQPDKLDSMVDPALLQSFDRSQLSSVYQVSRLCTHKDPHYRPTMMEVTEMLQLSLRITPEIAAPKGSLLWAELEILATS